MGISFSFPFFSLSRSDFGSQAGIAEQHHAISPGLCRLKGVQEEKKKHQSCLRMTGPDLRILMTFICAVWTESNWASALSTIKQEPEINKVTNGDHSAGLAYKKM